MLFFSWPPPWQACSVTPVAVSREAEWSTVACYTLGTSAVIVLKVLLTPPSCHHTCCLGPSPSSESHGSIGRAERGSLCGRRICCVNESRASSKSGFSLFPYQLFTFAMGGTCKAGLTQAAMTEQGLMGDQSGGFSIQMSSEVKVSVLTKCLLL